MRRGSARPLTSSRSAAADEGSTLTTPTPDDPGGICEDTQPRIQEVGRRVVWERHLSRVGVGLHGQLLCGLRWEQQGGDGNRWLEGGGSALPAVTHG